LREVKRRLGLILMVAEHGHDGPVIEHAFCVREEAILISAARAAVTRSPAIK
jgi:hypothetical protein